MSLLDSLNQFDRFSANYDNKYVAVRELGRIAKQISCSMHNVPLYSEAISWALSGEIPDISDRIRRARRQTVPMIAYTEELLCYVDDNAVKNSVRKTIEASRVQGHLVFIYDSIDESQKTRVRILSRMIWLNFVKNNNYGGNDEYGY